LQVKGRFDIFGSMLTKDLLIPKTPLPKLTAAQDRILSYLLTHPDNVAYMSSAELAQALDISNATVVRFSQHIGFKGYQDLQRHIREKIKARLSVPERVKKTPRHISSPGDFLKTVIKSDLDNLARISDTVSAERFEQIVNEIHCRKEVWVLGLRSCHGVAHGFATTLRFLDRRVNLITLDTGAVWDEIQPGLKKDALLITISFPRYSRQTYEIARKFSQAGATVAAITDSQASPLASLSQIVIPLPCWIDSFFESHVAVMSLLNAVLAGVSYLDGSKAMSQLERLEQIWEEKDVYLKSPAAAAPTWAGQFNTENRG